MGGIRKPGLSSRGQSEVIGAILVFGIVILFIGLLQLYLVPSVVADNEQDHVEQVEDDFAGVYTAITNAAGDNSERSAKIRLGTDYQTIPGLLMPSPGAGRLQSEGLGSITGAGGDEFDADLVEDTCGMSDIETHSLQYTPDYHEFRDAGVHRYETGLKYKAVNGKTLSPEQRLIVQSQEGTMTTINLVPITHGSTYESGTTARSLSFQPGLTGETRRFEYASGDDPVIITIPMTDETAWKNTFDSDFLNDANVDITYNEGEAELRLDETSHTYRIRCTPVGINKAPNNDPTPPRDTNDGNETGAFNPIGPEDLVLYNVTSQGGVEWHFENRDEDRDKIVTDVRIPWALEPGLQGSELNLTKDGNSVEVPIFEPHWTSIEGNWTFSQDRVEHVEVEFAQQGSTPNDGYAVVFLFDDGTTNTYLIAPQGEQGSG